MIFCSRKTVKNILRAEPFESLFQGKLIKGQPLTFGSSDPCIWQLGYHSFLWELSTSLSIGEKKCSRLALGSLSSWRDCMVEGGRQSCVYFVVFLPSTPQKTKVDTPSVF